MGKTLKHEIYYPDGGVTPNIPVAMQTAAESVDEAVSAISEAPFIVCGRTTEQSFATRGTFYNFPWNTEVWKQGVGHNTASDQNPDQFVIEEDGLYTVNAKVAFRDADHIAAVVINVNGSDRLNTQVDAPGSTVSTAYPSGPKPTTITDLKLSKGDVLRVRARSSKDNARSVPAECFFSLRKSAGFAS